MKKETTIQLQVLINWVLIPTDSQLQPLNSKQQKQSQIHNNHGNQKQSIGTKTNPLKLFANARSLCLQPSATTSSSFFESATSAPNSYELQFWLQINNYYSNWIDLWNVGEEFRSNLLKISEKTQTHFGRVFPLFSLVFFLPFPLNETLYL